MKNPWIRLYREALHNPKVVSLNDRQYRAWTNLLLVADDAGELPNSRDIACHLRMTIQEAESVLCELVEAGLVDIDCINVTSRKFKMHDWKVHQYISDVSTGRVQKFRSKIKDDTQDNEQKRHETVSETPPESESDTDTDKNPNGHLSFSTAARVRAKDQGFVLPFGKRQNDKKEKIVRRAEGLGIPTDVLLAKVNAHKAKNRPAYFTKLCVEWLIPKLPGIDEQILRDALWGTNDQYGVVVKLLMVVTP